MANIEKLHRESGTVYKAVIRKQGHPKQTRTFKTRSAAERWARQLEARIEQDDAGLSNEAQRHTLADAITRYRAEILPTLADTTARPYGIHLDHWSSRLGHLRLADLRPQTIAAERDALATGRKPATVARYLATLGSVLTACVEDWHWLTLSPLSQVKKPREPRGSTRFLSRPEIDRLLAACRESESPDLYLAVLLSLATGARQQEILGARWRDVDLASGTLTLRAERETVTKGGARSVPIPSEAIALLGARKAEADTRRKAADVAQIRDPRLIFPSRVSARRPIDLRTPWETALRRAGISGFRWHDMRHTAASLLAAQGASLVEIGAILGHKSANTTKRYAHLTESHTHRLLRRMAADVFGGSEG